MQALANIHLPNSVQRCTTCLAILLAALLTACGGGATQNAGNNTDTGSTNFVTGVAATGLSINGNVTLKDATGTTISASISQPSGTFSIDVAGLTPPYFLKATDITGTTTLYSIAGGSGNFNINPLTNLAVVAAAMKLDPLVKTPGAMFDNPANFANLTPAQIEAATNSVMAKMSPAFQASLNANGAGNVNPLTDSFQIGNGLDVVFDNYVVTLDTATGEVRETQVNGNSTTVLGMVDTLGSFPAAGIYNGTVDTTQSGGSLHQVHDMLITPSGEMRFVMDNGTQVIAHLTASGTTVSGAGKAYVLTMLNGLPTNFKFADGSTTIDLTINGKLDADTFTGTYSFGNYTDSFSFALNSTQTNANASLEKIAGTYASSTESSDIYIGHIEANGHIWGSSAGVAYSGLIQVIDSNINLYRVTLAYAQNGTYGYVSGLATFYEESPATDVLPKPTTVVADGFTGEISSLSYSQTAPAPHGKLLLQLTSPLQQIFVSAVRLSSQLQSVVIKPTPDSLLIQSVGLPSFSITTAGNIQISGSAAMSMFAGTINSSTGTINMIANPGDIALNGFDQVSFPLPPNVAALLPLAAYPHPSISWQYFSISPANIANLAFLSSSSTPLNQVNISGDVATGTLTMSSGGIVQLTGTLAITSSLSGSVIGSSSLCDCFASVGTITSGNSEIPGLTGSLSGSAGVTPNGNVSLY